LTNLQKLGLNKFFEKQFENYSSGKYILARVAIENKSNFILYTEEGETSGEITGKFHFKAEDKTEYPVVGDWVVVKKVSGENKVIIEKVLDRESKFSRKQAWAKTDEQIIAANIDTVFIITSLNLEINIRRIERYITMIRENNVEPVIILSKEDLCENVEEIINEVKTVSLDTKIYAISSIENKGMDELLKYFEGNKTVAVVGSSGVGKSTLINCLLNSDKMKVKEIAEYKDKGKHTTSHRELILLPGGGLIIDTPGMREVQMWEGSEGVSETFADVENFTGQCKFSDCKHKSEPGCAIKKAIENGELDEERYMSYLKLQSEIKYFENRNNQKALLAEKKKSKKVIATHKKNGNKKY